MNLCVSRN